MDDGKILTVGRNAEDKVDGRRAREVNLVDETGNAIGLFSPIMLFGPQTNNYDCASVYRISSYTTDESNTDIKDVPATTGVKIIRQKDKTNETIKEIDNATNNGDIMGWIAVSSPKEGESGIKGTIGSAPFKVFVCDGHVRRYGQLPDLRHQRPTGSPYGTPFKRYLCGKSRKPLRQGNGSITSHKGFRKASDGLATVSTVRPRTAYPAIRGRIVFIDLY